MDSDGFVKQRTLLVRPVGVVESESPVVSIGSIASGGAASTVDSEFVGPRAYQLSDRVVPGSIPAEVILDSQPREEARKVLDVG